MGAGSRARRSSLVVPAGVVVALLQLPLAYLAIRALGSGEALGDPLAGAGRSSSSSPPALLVAGVTAAAVVIGVALAWLVTRTDLPGRRLWGRRRGAPARDPELRRGPRAPRRTRAARACAQQALGVERLPDIRGYWGALLALTLTTYPYVYLLCAVRAAQPGSRARGRRARARPLAVEDVLHGHAARCCGRRSGVGAVLVALYTLSDFGVVSLMNYDALTRAIYLNYRALFDRTPAAVLALLLVVLTAAVLLIEAWTRAARATTAPRRAPRACRDASPLGRWRWPSLAFCGRVVAFFLALPAAVLGYWLGQGIENERDLAFRWAETRRLADRLRARRRRRGARGLAHRRCSRTRYPLAEDRAARAARLLRQRAARHRHRALARVLHGALRVARLPDARAARLRLRRPLLAAGAVRRRHRRWRRVSPRVEEAARGLGRGTLGTLKAVTVPLARSGVLAGAALVFLSAMKELPATLLLRPIGFDTLATEIWKLTTVGAYSRAALPALVLIVVSAPVLYLLSADRRPQSGSGVE